ncbi:MAG: class I SAM-dependent methyltransferase [Spirochaetaceae bacterium]|nr:class I SAM-dependent methyltransferase [Myxococcales bacterium]MCB9722501.1 class I SAM-dependent methyltransferase [Spirochaetaceae bacterium]
MDDASCRGCGGPTEPAFVAQERWTGIEGRFEYLRCRACGALQIARIPAGLERFYGPDYYPRRQRVPHGRGGGWLGWRRTWTRFALGAGRAGRLLAGRRFARLDWMRRTRTGVDAPILDAGCGSGRLLWRLHRAGFRDLTGVDAFVEPSAPGAAVGVGTAPAAAPRREGPRFLRASFEEHHGTYHLVMAHHSFEHAPDPRRAFRALAALVRPGGWLLLRVPLADGIVARHYGVDWVQLDAPRHLFLPTRETIARLAKDAGLRLAAVVDDSGPFQIWGSEVLRRGQPLATAGRGGRRVLGVTERLRARWRARALRRAGRGDQACFYLERVDDAPGTPAPVADAPPARRRAAERTHDVT